MNHSSYDQQLASFNEMSKKVVEFIKIVSDLWYDQSIELVIFRNQLVDKNVSDIVNLHQYAEDFVENKIAIDDTLAIAKAISKANLPASRLDVGKLAKEYISGNYSSAEDFVEETLGGSRNIKSVEPKDVVLYGFGRIGRLLARALASQMG